jgi:hypothetical protein
MARIIGARALAAQRGGRQTSAPRHAIAPPKLVLANPLGMP